MDPKTLRKLKALKNFTRDKEFASFEQQMEQTEAWNTLVQFLVGGMKGREGEPGKNGVSISGALIDKKGNLVLEFDNNKQIVVGNVVGPKGESIKGEDGIGIDQVEVIKGRLVVTYSNGKRKNVGIVQGKDYVLKNEDIDAIALSAESQLYPYIDKKLKETTLNSIFQLEEFSNIEIKENEEWAVVITKEGLKLQKPWNNVHTASPGFLSKLKDIQITNPTNNQILRYNSTGQYWYNDNETGGGSGVSDGDYGDIIVSGGGTIFTIDTGLDAAKIGDGSVSNTEFQYLNGVSSAIQTQLDNKAASLGSDDNYVTDAEKVKLSNLSGTNTGDQTSIAGISGTKAQFDTACSDGNFLYVGDITQYTDEMAQDAVGGILTDSSTIDFTYNDGAGTITADVKDNSITGAKIALGSDAAGDIMYHNGTDYVRLPKGTAKQVLSMNAGDTAPEWTDRYYVLVVSSAQNNPADSATVYFGTPVQASGTDSDESQMQIPISGTVVAVYQKVNVGTVLGTAEDVTWAFRLNDTTDTALTSMDYDVQVRKTSTTGLSIAVSAGDAFNIKTVNPAWATNPTGVRLSAEIVIKY